MKKLLAVFCPVVSVPIISITEIQKKKIKENKINNVVKNTAKEKIMTEEQYKECKEIYNSYNFDFRFLLIKKDEFIKITISLAKVFNKDITKEEAEKIIIINKVISGSTNPINNDIATFWAIVNYFDKGFDKKQEQKKEEATKIKEIINSCEEKYKKSLEELLDNFHEGYVPWALLFHYGDADTIYYYYNPIIMLFGGMVPLSFILSQMEGVENEFFEFLGNSKDKVAEIIIDITVSLSEIFNKNMTKEEVEKLLFIKNDIEKEDMGAGIPASLGKFCVFTEEFRKIIEEYYEKDKYGIERVILAIADYFDGKENYNNENEEKNKNFNKENKINNVVENTAKEKIMTEEQKKKCEEIINSYKSKLGDVDISLLINPFSSIFQSIHQYAVENITYMTISLAKVFNKDITEEEAKKIISDLREDYLKENPKDKKYKDFESMSWAIVDKLDDELILNLLILGQTGVGKSSLLNKLAGKPLFRTADDKEGGAKVRPNTDYGIFLETVEIDGKKVNVYDSWGLERNKAKEWDKLIKKELEERSVDKDIKDWFHSVTFCISAGKNGMEYIEIDTIKKFLNEKYNVIVALTQADYGNKEENDKLIDIIKNKTGANIVIPISANPKKSMIMTEAPKPFGLEEYKAAILVSWERIFTDRMPLHIIEKLKKDIENAKKNAPNRKPKDDDDLKKLAKEIDEYFINIINKKLPIHIKENFEKYNKITENIIDINTNIDISNFYSKKNIDPNTYIYDLIGFNLLHIFEHVKDLITYLSVKMDMEKYINNFIDKRVEEAIKYISKKEFEDNIRKIIIYNLENKNKN